MPLFQDARVHFVNISTYNANDVNQSDWQLLEVARNSCRFGNASISSQPESAREPLIMSIPVRGEFEIQEQIFQEAVNVIIAHQQQALQGQSVVDRARLFGGVPGTGY